MPPPAPCPRREMGADQIGGEGAPGGVERRGRLVEQPERTAEHPAAPQRQPPPLSGRQIADRQLALRGEGRPAQRRVRPWAAPNQRREDEVLAPSSGSSARRDG